MKTFELFNKKFAIVDHGLGTRQQEVDFHFDDLAFTTFEKRKFHFLGVTVQGCA